MKWGEELGFPALRDAAAEDAADASRRLSSLDTAGA